jgi:hypothetical protein
VDEVYRGFSIRAFESSPGKWKAEIRKVDGSPIQILLPELAIVLDCLTTDPEKVTAEAAILLAVGYRRWRHEVTPSHCQGRPQNK